MDRQLAKKLLGETLAFMESKLANRPLALLALHLVEALVTQKIDDGELLEHLAKKINLDIEG
ncbi:MAG: hypothetical protein K2W96_05715 [Gemmataceae bacterium]|nr:hypothetical protein [Gemmataceae bacterium]